MNYIIIIETTFLQGVNRSSLNFNGERFKLKVLGNKVRFGFVFVFQTPIRIFHLESG
jgi:hypothetical protein